MRYLLLLAVFLSCCPGLTAQNIYTLAGTGTAGGNDGLNGPAAAATFNFPSCVKTDKNGNVYVADWFNSMVKKISPDGTITAFAGTGGSETTDAIGPAAGTPVSMPKNILVDDSGNVYISVWGDYTIRKVGTDGMIRRFCSRYDPDNMYDEDFGEEGPALEAKITAPAGMASDSDGNFYFAQNDFRIRKVDAAGILHLAAGAGYGYDGDGGFAPDALLNGPNDVAVDRDGNLYVADVNNNVIRRIRPSGIISTFAGTGQAGFSGDGGAPQDALLNKPFGITIDSAGDFYIADWGNNVIRKISADGSTISTIAGTPGVAGYSGDGGDPLSATLNGPMSVAVTGNYIYIAETGNNIIRYIGPQRINPVPLQLLSFSGDISGRKSLLQWHTTQEINVSGYSLESGSNGSSFHTIATIKAGNLVTDNQYRYTDPSPELNAAGNVFYRLHMTDRDGHSTFSNVLRLTFTKQQQPLAIYPNPVKEILNITTTAAKNGPCTISVTDIAGSTILSNKYTLVAGHHLVQLPVSHLSPGTYVVIVQYPGDKQVTKFIKN